MATALCLTISAALWGGSDTCTCDAARLSNGWCAACEVGYVAGIRLESELLWEELDAHGHDIDPDKIECPTCRKGLPTDGYCEKCKIGFVGGQAYLSRLAYHLARGERVQPETLDCDTCRQHAERQGWCERCDQGLVGNVVMKDRTHFEQAVTAFETVLAAIRKLPECRICAVAIISEGYCPKCKVHYEDGKPQIQPEASSEEDGARAKDR